MVRLLTMADDNVRAIFILWCSLCKVSIKTRLLRKTCVLCSHPVLNSHVIIEQNWFENSEFENIIMASFSKDHNSLHLCYSDLSDFFPAFVDLYFNISHLLGLFQTGGPFQSF